MTLKVTPNRNKGLVMIRSGRTFSTDEIANAKILRLEKDWNILGTEGPVWLQCRQSEQGSVGDETTVRSLDLFLKCREPLLLECGIG